MNIYENQRWQDTNAFGYSCLFGTLSFWERLVLTTNDKHLDGVYSPLPNYTAVKWEVDDGKLKKKAGPGQQVTSVR